MQEATAFPRLRFRCQSISEPSQFHLVDVSQDGRIVCSCTGEPGRFCSHIDATLVHGERAMVPREDRHIADRAQAQLRGMLKPHKNWKSHWLTKRKWRGLPPRLSHAAEVSAKDGMPLLSLEGRGKRRRNAEEMITRKGWMIAPRPVRGCVFHLIPDDAEAIGKAAEAAAARSIPIITYQEWLELAEDITEALVERLVIWQGEGAHPTILAA